MSQPAVTVEHLSKKFRIFRERNQTLKAALLRGRRARYEEFWALRDVSFEVQPGEFFGIIGGNGSGKSTLLKCLTRILVPDEGRCEVNGQVAAMLELGSGFHPELSGRENVFLNASILGIRKKDISKRFDDIVQFAGVERFIDTPVKNYSSGMYVRLAFAVAINLDPEILIVDEVLAVGDQEFQVRCQEKFGEMRHAGKTLVIVTHDLGSVRQMCDRLAWLDHGHLVEVGTPGEVVTGYSSLALEHVQAERSEAVASDGAQAQESTEAGALRSAEISVQKVTLLNNLGQQMTSLHTGETLTVRIEFNASAPIPRPVFGVHLSQVTGAIVVATNTREAGVVPDRIFGHGIAEVTIPAVPLLPGIYDVGVSVCDYDILHHYILTLRATQLRVERSASAPELFGMVSTSSRWALDN
jgi:ABC-type polysaccharide/polyol phosphate transport system ATPase subunit